MSTDDSIPLGRIKLAKASDRSEHDSSVGLTEYLDDARGLDSEEFAARHGSYFLVRWLLDGPLARPAPLGSASWRKMTNVVPASRGGVKPYGGGAQAETFFAYPVLVAKDRTLSVGRAHTCDVCISDMSVSTQHAEIELLSGDVVITDRGSTNGTVVASTTVAFGESAVAEDGRVVQFGNVQLTFMTAAKFAQFVLAMCGVSR